MSTYTIIPGDTMWSIARKYGIKLNDLIAVNPQITNTSLIIPGQIINIPNDNSSTYKVVAGDTMWSIAQKHGIELKKLMVANPQITNPAFIFPSQNINIPTTSVSNNTRALETEVIRLVNSERAKVGQPTMIENNELSRIARIKANDFINNNYFGHNSPTYGTPFEMMRAAGITFTAAAENIARGQRTAAEVMNTWMNSSGHRANILNPIYNQIGVGVARDNNDNLYWTQMFIRN